MIAVPLKVTMDTFVNQHLPTTRYDAKTSLLDLSNQSSHNRLAYLYLAPPPRGCTVVSATLKLRLAGGDWSSVNVTAKRITESWKEKNIDYTNRPAVSATHAATTAVAGTSGDDIEIDVTDIYQDVAGGAAWHGLRLEGNSADIVKLHGSEDATPAARPYLVLEYSTLPEAAGDLFPDGDVVVYETSPTFSWKFLSVTPGEAQAQSQVVVTTEDDTDFSAPVYDSGMVANVVESWQDGALDLDADTPYIWRVTVVAASGGTSEPSDAASFSQHDAGALTITFPASDGDDVEDSTPTVTWTFADQTSWQVWVLDADGKVLKTSGLQAGTDLSWSIPLSVVLVAGSDYSVRVSASDDLLRPAPVEATRTWSFVTSGDVTTPTLTDAFSDGPGVRLEWSAATPPDHFGIRIGTKIMEWIDPADALVSGTDYAWTTFYTAPGVAQDVSVVAKVDDLGSGTGAVSDPATPISVTPQPVGIWLVSPTLRVYLTGQADNPLSLDQDGETFYLINRSAPVRIVGQARGFYGHVTGTIHDYTSRDGEVTDAEQRDAVEAAMLGDTVVDDLRLIWGTQSHAVIVGNAVIAQAPAHHGLYTVDFDFWTTDA